MGIIIKLAIFKKNAICSTGTGFKRLQESAFHSLEDLTF
uniref:Uncharacterized protein n=1 Tax=Anguilla anguilla TaxID=7936 RepID=A0A0E9WJL7_ANGAN